MSKETEDTLRKMLQEQTRKVEEQAEQLDILKRFLEAQRVNRQVVENLFAEVDQEQTKEISHLKALVAELEDACEGLKSSLQIREEDEIRLLEACAVGANKEVEKLRKEVRDLQSKVDWAGNDVYWSYYPDGTP